MTGSRSLAALAGVHTLRYRQSSLLPPPGGGGAPCPPLAWAWPGAVAGAAPLPLPVACARMPEGDPPPVHAGAKALADFTPIHLAAGCGARQRRSPTGGAANGIPR